MGYPELRAAAAGHMSIPSLHDALAQLEAAGYVANDAPPALLRKSKYTTFWPLREQVAGDFAATTAYLFG